jgi:hypothetical protein
MQTNTKLNPYKNASKPALKQIKQTNDLLMIHGRAATEENTVEIERWTPPKRINEQGRKCFSVLKPSSLH